MKKSYVNKLLLAMGSCVFALGLAACDSGSITVGADVEDPPVDPVDPAPPVAFAEVVSNQIATNTNDTAEPISINDLDIVIDNNADFQTVIDGGSGV